MVRLFDNSSPANRRKIVRRLSSFPLVASSASLRKIVSRNGAKYAKKLRDRSTLDSAFSDHVSVSVLFASVNVFFVNFVERYPKSAVNPNRQSNLQRSTPLWNAVERSERQTVPPEPTHWLKMEEKKLPGHRDSVGQPACSGSQFAIIMLVKIHLVLHQ